MDLTNFVSLGYTAGKQRLNSGPLAPGSIEFHAWAIGKWLAEKGYPAPVAANRARGKRQVRIKWSVSDMVNVVRCDLSGLVYEYINATTIRRV